MTAEEKRERLLKRILPGMAITIIYFIFISGTLSEKMTKAEDNYTRLMRKGISTASVPGVIKQQSQTQIQISALEKQHNEFKQKLKDLAGFLSNTTPSNETSTLLSSILANNTIRVKNEQRESFSEDALSPALKEVWQWLKPEAVESETNEEKVTDIYVQRLLLSGSYQNMYSAMATIAKGGLKAVPVSFSMKAAEDETITTGDLDWELLLWM
ncbi:MAG: hypothetical protein KAR12_11960 [Methylococcales bacterium]|nr:hypothetical protein [Methylococcales bacterium]